jgi:hypothetical protein
MENSSNSKLNESSGSIGASGNRRSRANRQRASRQGTISVSELNLMDKATEEKLSDLKKSVPISTRQ